MTLPGGNRSAPISASEARSLLERTAASPAAVGLHAATQAVLASGEDAGLVDADAKAYAAQFAHLVNFNQSAALVEILLPRGQASDIALLRQIRALAATPAFARSGFGFLVVGDIPSLLDAVDGTRKRAT